jgi:hypothetical protein
MDVERIALDRTNLRVLAEMMRDALPPDLPADSAAGWLAACAALEATAELMPDLY